MLHTGARGADNDAATAEADEAGSRPANRREPSACGS